MFLFLRPALIHVTTSLMPQGVEHMTSSDCHVCCIEVTTSLMPQGVDQNRVLQLTRRSADSCSFHSFTVPMENIATFQEVDIGRIISGYIRGDCDTSRLYDDEESECVVVWGRNEHPRSWASGIVVRVRMSPTRYEEGKDDMKAKRVTISQIDGEIVARIEFADVDKTGFMSTEDRNPSRGLGVYLGPSWEDDVASKPGAHGVVLRGVSDDPSVMEAWEAFMAALDGSGRVEVGQVIWEADDEG